MKKRKQIPAIGVLLLFIGVFIGTGQAFALTSEAAGGASVAGVPTVLVEEVSAAPGETVEVNVSVANNPGILGATFTLAYHDQLTLINAQAGDAFDALSMTKPGKFTSPCNFVWDGQDIEEADVKDGVILTLTFKVSSEARAGDLLDVKVSCAAGGAVDRDLLPVQLTMADGGVCVADGSESTSGISFNGMIDETEIILKLSSEAEYKNVTLLVVSYANSGQMLDCEMKTVTVPKGESTYSFEKKCEDAFYKGFALDGKMCPLSPAVQIRETKSFTVTFTDYDGTPLSVQNVLDGEDAVPPADPVRAGYVFIGWDGSYTNVTSNQTVVAQYREDTSPAIVVSTVSANPGDTGVQVPILVRNNPGILGMTLTLSYDTESLALTGAVNGAAVKEVLSLTKPGKYVSPCNFVWDGQEISPEQIRDGEILILTFDVAESAPAGTYPIEISYKPGSIIDNEFGALSFTLYNGGITIS